MKLVLAIFLSSVSALKLDTQAKGDGDAAVAKTAAIKNIQKALTARILKRLDDGQPLVEVARKMKAIEGMQPQINDMERRLGIMQSVEPVLENAIKTLQKVVDVRGMGKKTLLQLDQEIEIDNNRPEQEEIELIVSDFGKGASNKHRHHKVSGGTEGEKSKKDNQTQSIVQKQSNSTSSGFEQNVKTLQSRTSSEDSDALQAFTDAVVDKNCHSIAQESSNSTQANETIAQANTTSNVTANATTNETIPDADSNAQTSTKGIGAAAAMAQDNAEAEEKEAMKKAAVDNKKKKQEKAAKDEKKVKDEKKAEEGEEMEDKKVEKKADKKDKKEKKAEVKEENITEADKSAGKNFTDTHDRKNPLKQIKKWTAGFEDDPSDLDEHYTWETS